MSEVNNDNMAKLDAATYLVRTQAGLKKALKRHLGEYGYNEYKEEGYINVGEPFYPAVIKIYEKYTGYHGIHVTWTKLEEHLDSLKKAIKIIEDSERTAIINATPELDEGKLAMKHRMCIASFGGETNGLFFPRMDTEKIMSLCKDKYVTLGGPSLDDKPEDKFRVPVDRICAVVTNVEVVNHSSGQYVYAELQLCGPMAGSFIDFRERVYAERMSFTAVTPMVLYDRAKDETGAEYAVVKAIVRFCLVEVPSQLPHVNND